MLTRTLLATAALSAVGIGALAMVWTVPAAAQSGVANVPPNACSPTVEQKIAELKVNRADIDRIAISPRYDAQNEGRNEENTRLLGFDAWVVYKKGGGSLVIDMMLDCTVRQVYTRGDLALPGIRAF